MQLCLGIASSLENALESLMPEKQGLCFGEERKPAFPSYWCLWGLEGGAVGGTSSEVGKHLIIDLLSSS